MVVEYRSAAERYKIPLVTGDHVFFRDIFGTNEETQSDRMAGIWFRIEKGSEAGPGVHDYDESGIVWEGNVKLRDETGNVRTLGPGDSFFIHRGSTVLFSSTDYGICYKCAARPMARL